MKLNEQQTKALTAVKAIAEQFKPYLETGDSTVVKVFQQADSAAKSLDKFYNGLELGDEEKINLMKQSRALIRDVIEPYQANPETDMESFVDLAIAFRNEVRVIFEIDG